MFLSPYMHMRADGVAVDGVMMLGKCCDRHCCLFVTDYVKYTGDEDAVV